MALADDVTPEMSVESSKHSTGEADGAAECPGVPHALLIRDAEKLSLKSRGSETFDTLLGLPLLLHLRKPLSSDIRIKPNKKASPVDLSRMNGTLPWKVPSLLYEVVLRFVVVGAFMKGL